jgi:hypothetical protein
MSHSSLNDLYDATEENLLYAVGLLAQDELEPVPIVCIHYTRWSREQLSVVRESCRDGLVLSITRRPDGLCDLHISTRQRLAIQTRDGEHTRVLNAPDWDAHLEAVNETVISQFEAGRQQVGGYLLLMQTPDWEFLTAVEDTPERFIAHHVRPRSPPVPPATSQQPT